MKRIATGLLSLVVICALSCPVFGADAYGEPLSASIRAAEAGDRTYASAATGAPRAVGRTEAGVRALTEAARAETVGYEFGKLAQAASVPDVVHVAQFGAHGDGSHDDRAALQAAFDSGAKTILFEHDATYKVNGSLKLGHGDVTLLGDSAVIFTDADYDDGDERLLSVTGKVPNAQLREAVADDWENHPDYYIENVGIYQLNMLAKAYDAADGAHETMEADSAKPADGTGSTGKRKAYSKQLMVQMAANVDIFDCAFTIERPESGCAVDGCTALDAYTGWHDVTVEKCTVRDFCDKEAGGGIWIRDHFNMGSSNMVFKRNDFEKMCHDEILAVFNSNVEKAGVTARPIEDVLIAESTFAMHEGDDEKSASPSVMAITVKCAHDVLIENNDMDVRTTGGLVWSSSSSGVVVRGNDIVQTRSHVAGDTNFLMFRGAIDLVEGNRMTIKALDETAARNHRYVFSTDGTVRDNVLVSDLALECVTNGSGVVEGNAVRLNAPVHVIFDSGRVVAGNEVELNAHADQYFQYYRTVFAQDVVISDNVVANKVEGDSHSILVLNEATMGGHVVRFSGNFLTSGSLGADARLLFLKLLDEDPQENCVVFSGNEIANLKAYGVYRPDARHTYMVLEKGDEPGPTGGDESGTTDGGSGSVSDEAAQVDEAPHAPDVAPASGRISINGAKVTLAQASCTYSGKQRRPSVKSVELAGKLLSAKTDYRVSYGANRNVGAGKVIVTGVGSFEGSAVATFRIVPKATSLSKLVVAKRGFNAKWKKQAVQVTGYQLQCSLTKSFKSKKTFSVAKPKTVTKKVSKLKPLKRYYVRVRTYKTVAGATYYSAWSAVKSVTTCR